MKTDNYLALCLEQAAQSPLHYRHDAIVVRGGKVIGKDINDNRHGFNGGALKSGKIAQGGFDGPAIAELKYKLKNKSKPKQEDNSKIDDLSTTFVPFEGMTGGGHLANTPLSMHSEMMAIHSALAQSSTLASTTVSSIKPSFKLPSSNKHHTRLRNERLKAYGEAVCRAALEEQTTKPRTGESHVQEWRFEASASQPHQVGQGVSQRQGTVRRAGGHGGVCGETPEEEERRVWEEGSQSVSVSTSQCGQPFWSTIPTGTLTTCV